MEAAHSIARQTYRQFEVVVIDDGSTPPISLISLQEVLGERVRLYRHDQARGVPKAKNAGIRRACGEIICLLDDDDLLKDDALETIATVFSNHPKIDCLFLGVRPFGAYAEVPAKNRKKAIRKIINQQRPVERDGVFFFSEGLFEALLNSVPIDFQRPAARRGAWNIVGGFEESCLFSESQWAIRAASMCTIALTKSELTQWRIHENNFGWDDAGPGPNQAELRQLNNDISSLNTLLLRFNEQVRLKHVRVASIKKSLSDKYFNKAYYLCDADWPSGIKELWKSFYLAPRPQHLKLAAKYLFPVRWRAKRSLSKGSS